jgi:hypothetical protein
MDIGFPFLDRWEVLGNRSCECLSGTWVVKRYILHLPLFSGIDEVCNEIYEKSKTLSGNFIP